jgi:hypothetical protein
MTYPIEDLPYSFAKQRKVLKSIITPTSTQMPAISEGARFIDLFISPTITHYLAYRYPNNKFYIVDKIGFCEALKEETRQKLIDLRNDLIEAEDDEMELSDCNDIISNYFGENISPFLKKYIKSFYTKVSGTTPDDAKAHIKAIPEGWEDKLMRFNYNHYFPQNVEIINDVSNLGSLSDNDVLIIDEPKMNVVEVFEKFKTHPMFVWNTLSSNSTGMTDLFNVLGLGWNELFCKTRNLKTGIKMDKFVFKH